MFSWRALLVALLTMVTVASPVAAAGDRIASVTASDPGALPGAAVRLTVTLKAGAQATVSARLVAGRRVIPLTGTARAGSRAGRLALKVTVPKRVAVAAYRLEVCATTAGTRSCRAARRLFAISAPLTPAPGGEPLTVTPTLDDARAATATIGASGGTLAVTTADGSTATLTIPAGALATDIPITMTPVTGITGHPQNPGLLVGVDIQPGGFNLGKPARLQLTPVQSTKPIQRAVLTGDGEGHNTRPDLFTDAGQGATVDLVHFSVYELVFVSSSDHAGQVALFDWTKFPPATGNAETLRAELARLMEQERQRQAEGTSTEETRAQVSALQAAALEAYYNEVVVPYLAQGRGNCSVMPVGVATAFAWYRQVALMGQDEAFTAESQEMLSQVRDLVTSAFACLERRCDGDHYPEAIFDIMGLQRSAALAGIVPPDGFTLFEQMDRCLRFRVVVESEIGYEDAPYPGVHGLFRMVVSGSADTGPLTSLSNNVLPLPDLKLSYTETTGQETFPGSLTGCSGSWVRKLVGGEPGTITLKLDPLTIRTENRSTATIIWDAGSPFALTQGPREHYLSDTSAETCPVIGVPESVIHDENWWARMFIAAHSADRASPDADYPLRITGFRRATNPDFLEKRFLFEGRYDGVTPFYEITVIRIVHTPAPLPPT